MLPSGRALRPLRRPPGTQAAPVLLRLVPDRGQRAERKTDDADHAEYVKRLVEAQGKRAGADLPMFALFAEAVDFARARLQDAADQLIAQGHSYSQIGAALGITRQAAWKRFGRKPRVDAGTPESGAAG